jgi:hypothetical protein
MWTGCSLPADYLPERARGMCPTNPGTCKTGSRYRTGGYTITPQWAAAVGMDEATAATWRAEDRSKVAFDIEDVGHGVVKLTVTHDGFAPGSAVLPAISEGWPAVLASLKTLLETGSSLRTS